MRQKVALAGALVHDPRADHPRRAAHRARRRLRAPGQDRAARARARRRHRDHDHAYPRGRRAHGRPHRRHRRRPADRAGHARRAARPGRASAPPASKTRSSRSSPSRRPRREPARRRLTWFAHHELRLAWRDWLAHDDGRRRAARAHGRDRADRCSRRFMHLPRLFDGRPLCRRHRRRPRQGDAGRRSPARCCCRGR